jgi:hypothetical protein
MSAPGPSRKSRDVRLESEMRAIADISYSATPSFFHPIRLILLRRASKKSTVS